MQFDDDGSSFCGYVNSAGLWHLDIFVL